MKKILTTIAIAAMAAGAFAQGYINYSLSFTYITAQTNATVYSPLFGGGSANGTQGVTESGSAGALVYDYALLYQPSTGPSTLGILDSNVWDGSWQAAGALFVGTNNNTAGRLSALNSGNQQVPWANGVTNNIIVVGWSGNLGSSWLTVSNELANWSTTESSFAGQTVFFGESTLGYISPNLSTPGAAIVNNAATANGLPIYSLNTQLYELPTTAVPEPGTMALAGLGGLSMLLFRRKK
jgi:hypothetical protein